MIDEFIYYNLNSYSTLILFLIIALSLRFLGRGADLLVDQAVKLSLKWGISKMIVGATVVSLGTTIPEVTVSLSASLKGNADLALGNAVGSIITNTGLIIGLSSLLGKIKVDPIIVKRQGNIQLFVTFLLVLISIPSLNNSIISKKMGFILTVILIAYIGLNIYWSKIDERKDGHENEQVDDQKTIIQILLLLIGFLLVIVSSKILIPSVEIVAVRLGVPQTVVAATLVAFGTSLPELVTSITAVRKGYGELAVGNVIGANILNVLFVVGVSALVSVDGLTVSNMFYSLYYPTMLLLIILFYIFMRNKGEEISNREGLILLIVYLVYLVLNYKLS